MMDKHVCALYPNIGCRFHAAWFVQERSLEPSSTIVHWIKCHMVWIIKVHCWELTQIHSPDYLRNLTSACSTACSSGVCQQWCIAVLHVGSYVSLMILGTSLPCFCYCFLCLGGFVFKVYIVGRP